VFVEVERVKESVLIAALCSLFVHHATRVNGGGTPTVALLLSTVATAALLLSGTFGAVLGVFALLLGVNLLLMSISLVVLRRSEPDAPRPYRARGYPVLCRCPANEPCPR